LGRAASAVQRRSAPGSRPSAAKAAARPQKGPRVPAAELEAFVRHCKAHGLSVTQQRLAIFEALAGSRSHPSAEQIYSAVKQRHPSLSLATVYKNLDALRAVGAVSDVNPLHLEARYEAALPGTGAGEPHHHLVCTSCHKVCDLPASLVAPPQLTAALSQGFEIRGVRIQVEGLCADCR
jgi:Fe2+ or Zn2+ uptake regulation protein